MSGTVLVFLLILCASFVFTAVLSRLPGLRVPSAVGYLLFGALLQTHLFTISTAELKWIGDLGDIGLYFLMFLSGLEVDLSLLRPNRGDSRNKFNPARSALSIFLLTLLVSYTIAMLLVQYIPQRTNPWMLTLLFTTTSLGVILPTLEETRVLHSEYGQVLLLSALLADLLTILLISLFITSQAAGGAKDFLLALTVLPVTAIAYYALQWVRKIPSARAAAGQPVDRTRAVIALVAGFCALAEFSGAEPIVGSFLVGLLISAIPFAYKTQLRQHAHGIGYGFLIPLFFLSVGIHFNASILLKPTTLIWVPVLFLVGILVKVIPAWQLRKRFGGRAVVAGGMLLSARLGLIVAAADIGVQIGALPPFMSEAVTVVGVLSCIVAPIAFTAIV